MNRILEVNAAELLTVCEAAVPTSKLSAAAAEVGLLYPPDPGSHTVSTIGGNVATCAGGLRGLKYGVTRDWVLGVEAVLPTGEIVRCGGRLTKDVAGYDLTRLLCGSEGTLAVITEVTVRLAPAPQAVGYGIAYFATLADAAAAVGGVIAAGLVPATLEFLDNVCVRAVEAHAHLGLNTCAGALLLFGDDGHPQVVADSLSVMAQACKTAGATSVEVASDAATSDELLSARRCCLPAMSRLGGVPILEDVGVPRDAMPQMVAQIQEIAARHGVLCGTFGHAGDGNLHPTVVVDPAEAAAVARAKAAFDEIFSAALALNGTITGEHGVGAAKLPHLQEQLGAAQIALQRRLKAAFDPAGILNPGKLGS